MLILGLSKMYGIMHILNNSEIFNASIFIHNLNITSLLKIKTLSDKFYH